MKSSIVVLSSPTSETTVLYKDDSMRRYDISLREPGSIGGLTVILNRWQLERLAEQISIALREGDATEDDVCDLGRVDALPRDAEVSDHD